MNLFPILQARKKLVSVFQDVVDQRRKERSDGVHYKKSRDMIDGLINATDESGNKLDDEQIIDTMLTYLHAGHESSGYTTMWATIYLQQHPEVSQKAKVPYIFSSSNKICKIGETLCLLCMLFLKYLKQ